MGRRQTGIFLAIVALAVTFLLLTQVESRPELVKPKKGGKKGGSKSSSKGDKKIETESVSTASTASTSGTAKTSGVHVRITIGSGGFGSGGSSGGSSGGGSGGSRGGVRSKSTGTSSKFGFSRTYTGKIPSYAAKSVSFKGGSVMSQPLEVYLIWHGTWPASQKTPIQKFVDSISEATLANKPGSVKDWWNINRLYKSGATFVTPTVSRQQHGD
ncbi:hypothetical protein CLOM_g3098 [Closterium sp. NIES-68]|nr:hypothetical protein CLOM_g3098 [Closterium sp. NIES-68]